MHNDQLTELIGQHLKAAGSGAYVDTGDRPRAHRQVKDVAYGICQELYDTYATKWDDFYKVYPNADAFASAYWSHFCSEARATLAKLLASGASEHLKAQAYSAIILDESLARSRAHVLQVKMDL